PRAVPRPRDPHQAGRPRRSRPAHHRPAPAPVRLPDVLRAEGLDEVRLRGSGRADRARRRLRAAAGRDRAQRAGVLGRRGDPRDLLAGGAPDAEGGGHAGGGRHPLTELFSPAAYEREDESADARFYELPRKVVHIDDAAIAALGRLYEEVLPAGGRLTD